MRAARRHVVLGVVRCGTGPSPRVRARAVINVAYDRIRSYNRFIWLVVDISIYVPRASGPTNSLHAVQGGRRHHGRFCAPEEEKRGGGAWGRKYRRASPGDAALGHDQCRRCRGDLAMTRAAEEGDGDDRGRVRGVWPHPIGGQD